jgi:hypothetical protein
MKFYNITKLDVEVGDTVYDEYDGNAEYVYHITKCNIITMGMTGAFFTYDSMGIWMDFYDRYDYIHNVIGYHDYCRILKYKCT